MEIWHTRTGPEMVSLPWTERPHPHAVGERRALVGTGAQAPVIEFPALGDLDAERKHTHIENGF